MADRRYRINNYRWETAYLEGFDILESGGIKTHFSDDGNYAGPYFAFLKPVDSGEEDSDWGRLAFKCEHKADATQYVYVFATDEEKVGYDYDSHKIWDMLSDENVSGFQKRDLLMQLGAKKYIDNDDILLYEQKGRYLYLAFEAVGDSPVSFEDMCVYSEGDFFMQAFPEVYRERNGFFHRWLSVYSSIFNDISDEIDNLPKLLDIDTCPAELLPTYASWLGLDISGGFLSEDICRQLVKEAYNLSRIKGTARALSRIIEIVLGCEAEIIEHNTMRGYLLSDGAELPANLKEGGVYDVTILVHGHIKEIIRHRLMFLLEQFKPVRARLHLIELDKNAVIDGNAYLDMNATIPVGQAPTLDDENNSGMVLTLL